MLSQSPCRKSNAEPCITVYFDAMESNILCCLRDRCGEDRGAVPEVETADAIKANEKCKSVSNHQLEA